MVFFGFGTSATLIDDEPIIPEEPELLDALRAAYRDPNVSTTKAMHQVAPPLEFHIRIQISRGHRDIALTRHARADRAGSAPQVDREPEAGA